MKLTHSSKCECGNEFTVDAPLIPNVKDREFYGGRINFFKEVKCDCGKEYVLCIEKSFSSQDGFGLNIVDMIDTTDEAAPLETLKGRVKPVEKKEEEKIDTSERTLTTVVSRELQVEKLKLLTMNELHTLCKQNKIKFKVTESKATLIDRLLDNNPSLVVAAPEGSAT